MNVRSWKERITVKSNVLNFVSVIQLLYPLLRQIMNYVPSTTKDGGPYSRVHRYSYNVQMSNIFNEGKTRKQWNNDEMHTNHIELMKRKFRYLPKTYAFQIERKQAGHQNNKKGTDDACICKRQTKSTRKQDKDMHNKTTWRLVERFNRDIVVNKSHT